ncbi:hypothetical protein FKP32DRAFT_1549847, partial [Trametes sanguinea]
DEVKRRVENRYAMGQCDGWKNIAKTNVVSTVMSVEHEPYLVKTHDMTGEPKTGDRMFELIKSDIATMERDYQVDVIGWCTDDGPDGKKARRLLFETFAYLIVLVCWAHQINLIVGDLLGLAWIAAVIRDAVEVVKWFNSHGVALELLKAEQKVSRPNAQPYALIRPVQTRWTSHYLAAERLVLLRDDISTCVYRNHSRMVQSVGGDADAIAKAHWIVAKVRDSSFWDALHLVTTYLRPLAVAANITQASDTRLDHVLLTLATLYQSFTARNIDRAADQDVFILAVFFNPYVRGYCFNRDTLPPLELVGMARRAYKRFFNIDTDSSFMQGLLDYSRGAGEFSSERMLLDDFSANAKQDKERVNILRIWQFMDNVGIHGVAPTGRSGIAHLAVRLLSVVANSGDTERVFSEFGATHTERRSRLMPEKVHRATEVKMHLNRCHVASNHAMRKKRK